MDDFERLRLVLIAAFALTVYGIIAITLAMENRK